MNFQDTDVTVDVCGQLFVHGEAFPSGRGLRGRNGDEVTAGFGPPDSSGCLITGVAHPLTTARMASVTVMSNEIDTTVPPSGDGRQECLAGDGWWVQPRRCAAGGQGGWCDSAPARH